MNIKKYSIIGFVFTVILGSLLHFAYDFFNQNLLVGYFSAVNESTWEHLKLLITPILIFTIIEYFLYGYDIDNFIIVKAVSILLGMIAIVSFFYTYTGIIGKNFLPLDILTFVFGVFVSYYFSYKMLNTKYFYRENSNYIGFFIFFILVFCMIYFTTNPPQIKLFLDPVTNTYGIPK